MKKYKEIIYEFIKDVRYMIPVCLVAILGFGFVVTHASVNIDTLAYNRYFQQKTLLGQGRFAAPLLNKIFGIMQYNPWLVDLIAVILLIMSSILLCSLIKRITKNKINLISYIIFSCLFISYPLMPEIFTYTPASLNTCLGYLLTIIALIITREFIENKKIKNLLYSSVLLCIAISLYESFASVYLLGIFMILILENIFSEKKILLKKNIFRFFILILTLVISIIMNSIIIKILFSIFDLQKNQYAAKTIYYLTMGIFGGIKNLIKGIIENYFLCSVFYFPLTIFSVSICICFIYGIIKSITKKNMLISILFIGLILSSLSLSIIQGSSAPYRTCQTFAILTGFIFMILSNDILKIKKIKILKYILITIIYMIIFYQVQDLHKWFYINYQRYEEEKNIIVSIGNKIQENYDYSKPIVFIGTIELSKNIKEQSYLNSSSCKGKMFISIWNAIHKEDLNIGANTYIRKIPDSNVNSYINWGVVAFGEPGVELIKWFNLLGYDFTNVTVDMYNDTKANINQMTEWPKQGSIVEYEDYIIVDL